MHFTAPVAAAVLAFVPATMAANIPVTLGANNNLLFQPNTAQANVGDTMTFTFANANHTVVSTSQNNACVADNQVNSGYLAVNQNTPQPTGANPPNKGGKKGKLFGLRGVTNVFDLESRQNGGGVTFTVQMTQPGIQMFACVQAAHCQNGMFMAVNVAPATGNKKRQNGKTGNGNTATANGNAGTANAGTANLQQVLQQYNQQARNVQTSGQANIQPGTGGTLSSQAQQLLQKNAQATNTGKTGKTGKAGANGANANAQAQAQAQQQQQQAQQQQQQQAQQQAQQAQQQAQQAKNGNRKNQN